MSIEQTAETKVEEAIAGTLRDYDGLSGWTVLTDQAVDVALTDDQLPALVIRTLTTAHDNSFEPGAQTLHSGTIDIEAVVKGPDDSIRQRAQLGLAYCVAALGDDRSLGGMLQDLQEIDDAPVAAQRKDAGAISLQWRADYLTGRADWFYILGLAGMRF